MKTALLAIIASFMCLSVAIAKRQAPTEVPPLVYQGVEYRAPLERMGVVEARDKATDKLLWDKQVYTAKIDPKMEEDVQHVFIRKLEIEAGKLVVTNERNERFSVDLKTHEVTKLGKPPGSAKN